MSKYDSTKFYWLQLKEDFFDDDAIQWLEEQQPNGRDYAYFYLKLCLKSLKSNGVLVRKVGNILIPYDNKKLAELTKMDFDTVTVAMELLKNIGLVQILDNGKIYLQQVENMIGSQSKSAFKKQQQRIQKNDISKIEGGQMSAKCPPEIELDLELELELEIESKKEKEKKINKKNSFEEEFEKLWKIYPRKIGKPNALKAYIKARETGTTYEEVKSGLENYKEYVIRKNILEKYTKHGSTWFNQQCWLDDYGIETNTDVEKDENGLYIV